MRFGHTVTRVGPIRIENIVATCPLGFGLDLSRLALLLPESEYDPEHFHALVHRDEKNRGSLLVNSSGIVVCVGFKSRQSLEKAVDDFVHDLQLNDYPVVKGPIEIRNLVASARLPYKLDLSRITLAIDSAEYEPEQFPGIVLRLDESNATVLVFGSGKLICTGTTNREDAESALRQVCARVLAV